MYGFDTLEFSRYPSGIGYPSEGASYASHPWSKEIGGHFKLLYRGRILAYIRGFVEDVECECISNLLLIFISYLSYHE
jgi:hypothetical protein